MSSKLILFFILAVDTIILLFQTTNLSISAAEASLLYGNFSFFQLLIHTSIFLFGQNDFGLRFAMILLHILSTILIYLISKQYIQQERNRLWLVLIFILLPGVVSSAIVVNSAGMILFGLLLYIYLSERKKASLFILNVLLLFYSCIDIGFSYLFLALSVLYILDKRYKKFTYMIALYLLNSILYGFEVYGSPSGHFLDTIGLYSAIFSPIVFIYLVYILYRRYFIGNIDLIWYLASTTLILSFVLSFRQRIAVEHFAPYLIIALPIAAESFISSYRVRLKMYRAKYKFVFALSFVFLLMNTLALLFHKELYVFIKNPKHHFTYDMDVAKELAHMLKKENVLCVTTSEKMQKRLYFYGVNKCTKYVLKELPLSSKVLPNVSISYKNRVLYKAIVTNINNI